MQYTSIRLALATASLYAAATVFGQETVVRTADVDIQLDTPGGGVNQLTLDVSAVGTVTVNPGFGDVDIPINASDSDSSTASGNVRCDLLLNIDPATFAATATEITFKRSRILIDEDPSFTLDFGSYLIFPIGTVTANGTDLVGTAVTPSPPGTVTGSDFPLAPHRFELHEGTITANATGLAADFIAPTNIDLADTPQQGPLGTGNGTVSVSFLSRDGLALSYTVQLTAVVDFNSVVLNDPVDVTITAAGTLRATGVVTVMLEPWHLGAPAEVLFADSFNRPNSVNLNAVTTGKTGTLGALDWNTRFIGSTDGAGCDIIDGRLRLEPANSNDGPLVYPDHNFVDAAILSNGTFTVRVDPSGMSTGGDNREAGFGIGQSLAEINSMTGVEGRDTRSDVYVGYDRAGGTTGIEVFENGAGRAYYPATPADGDILSADFTFSDMNAGSPLHYEVFLNGTSLGTGSTTWSGSNENYIFLAANTDVRFDDFAVSSAYRVRLNDFRYDAATGDAEVSISGGPFVSYELLRTGNLVTPDWSAVAVLGVTVGTTNGTVAVADESGNSTAQFNLGPSQSNLFIRAEMP